jgi:hypothetical protein
MSDVERGKLVLPEFQQNFAWRPDDKADLFVLGKYPIGAFLLMEMPESTNIGEYSVHFSSTAKTALLRL